MRRGFAGVFEKNRQSAPLLLANDAEDAGEEGSRLVGLANAFAVQDDGWVQLAPMGEHRHGQYTQRVTSKTVRRVIASFKADAKAAGSSFAGMPFYIGHPDVPHLANEYPDKKAYGWVMDLAEREDGLYGQVKWSEAGRTLIANAHYKFLSPYWELEAKREGNKTMADPVSLISVGLTNRPNFKGLKPLANEEPGGSEDEPMKQGTKMATLVALLKLANDVSDTEVETAAHNRITTLETEKTQLANEKVTLEGKLQTEQTAKTQLANDKKAAEDKFVAERKARVNLLLANSVETGRITAAEEAGYRVRLENEGTFEATATELATKPARVKTAPETNNLGGQKLAIANERERSATVQEKVAEKQAKGLSYDAAHAAVRREYPELFAAMHKPKSL